MADQHCPGFESNKSLAAVKIKCPECGLEIEVFSDEMDKKVTCVGCNVQLDPAECKVD